VENSTREPNAADYGPSGDGGGGVRLSIQRKSHSDSGQKRGIIPKEQTFGTKVGTKGWKGLEHNIRSKKKKQKKEGEIRGSLKKNSKSQANKKRALWAGDGTST